MTDLTLAAARKIADETLAQSRAQSLNAMTVAVLDARGALVAFLSEDGASLIRWKIAFGKAYGALALGQGSRRTGVVVQERPAFIAAATHLSEGGLVPVAGGVLIRDANRKIVGAVGVSGDTSDKDEAVALAAIAAAGFVGDGG